MSSQLALRLKKMSDQQFIAELREALNSLSWSEFQTFAVHLGIHLDVPTLKRIEEDRPTTDTRILHALQIWLDRDPGASWAKIVYALGKIGKNSLAQQVHSEYCTARGSAIPPSFSQSSPLLSFVIPLSYFLPRFPSSPPSSSQSPISTQEAAASPALHVDTSSWPRAESTTQPPHSPELRGTAIAQRPTMPSWEMNANQVKNEALWNALWLKDIYPPRGPANGWF